jgi:outer membrane protein assembly factor BamB
MQSGVKAIQLMKKQAFAVLLMLILVFSSAMLVTFAQPAADEWPSARHDTAHSGYSSSRAPVTNQLLWKYKTGCVVGGADGSPTVAGGRVYIGAWDQNMYCLDAATGAFLWSYTTQNIVFSSAAVVGGRVYFGSCDGALYCLDAYSGAFIWKDQLQPLSGSGPGIESSPSVVDGRVYIGTGDDYVYCLDAATGATLWNYKVGATISCSPAVVDGKVYVGADDSKTYCLNALTGGLIWSCVAYELSDPMIWNGRVFFGSIDNNIRCLDASNGTLLWNHTAGYAVSGSPSVGYGKLYITANDCKVYCLDPFTGMLIWSTAIDSSKTWESHASSPALADGKIYVGSLDNCTYCLDASNGTIIWKFKTNDYIISDPAVVDGRVFVGSNDGYVYAFAAPARKVSAGVSSGDWFKYAINASWSSTDSLARIDPDAQKLVNMQWIRIQVISVSGSNVTVSETDHFKNATEITRVGWMDVETGARQSIDENLFIPTDLSPGGLVYSQSPYSAVQISELISKSYSSGLREVDRSKTHSSSNYYSSISVDCQWDKATGLMVEDTKTFSNQTTQMSLSWVMTDSSVSVFQAAATVTPSSSSTPTNAAPISSPTVSSSQTSSTPTESMSPISTPLLSSNPTQSIPTSTSSGTILASPIVSPFENAPSNLTSVGNQQTKNSAILGSVWAEVILGIVVAATACGAVFFVVHKRRLSIHNRARDGQNKVLLTGDSLVGSTGHVFISHVEEDKKAAKTIADNLEKAGYTTWYYERDSVPGQSYILVSNQAIVQSSAVVLIISRDSLRSKQVDIEVVRAHEAEKPFVPVMNGVSYAEFQNSKPEWRMILGSTASVDITKGGEAVVPRIMVGLKGFGVSKKNNPV